MVKQADVPDGTIDEVKDWVNEDESESQARAKKALEVENKREQPRSTLVGWLEAASQEEPEPDADPEADAPEADDEAEQPGLPPAEPEDIDSALTEEEQAKLDEDEITHLTGPVGADGPADFVDPAAQDGTGEQADADLEEEGKVAFRDSNVLRADQQEVGTTSDSAWNVRRALDLGEGDEWDDELDEAIKAYQQDHGQKVTGRLTRDQARRLKLAYVG